MVREKILKYKNKLLRYWIYFQRGHSSYLVFLLSFANFVVIQYRLLIQYVSFLKIFFINLTSFLVTFLILYVPLAIIIGWIDYKRATVPAQIQLHLEVNPWRRDLANALYLMCEGKYDEAKKVLEKWLH